jgi:hypothetical protein
VSEDLSDGERAKLMGAGSSGLTFNAPLGETRARALIDAIAWWKPATVVDFGCGTGTFIRWVTEALRAATGVGIDTDIVALELARRAAAESPSAARTQFVESPADAWSQPCDTAISIGSSHAFGGTEATLNWLHQLPAQSVVFADGIWSTEPDDWCLETFGEQPIGIDGLTAIAEAAGWNVVDASESTIAEWDDFESRWIAGVRSIGSEAATTFADMREVEYASYRGVLGFGWLTLRRQAQGT